MNSFKKDNGHRINIVKARFVITGQVQRVGYRALIKQIARNLHIKGIVRNLEDGSVEIYCESDKETIDKFKKFVDIKGKKEDAFSINVENINTYFENEKGYGKGPDTFKLFEVDYGKEAGSEFEKANLERLELGSVGFLMLKDSIETKFDTMEIKYHNIHKGLEMLTYAIMIFAEHFAPDDEKIKMNLGELKKRIGV